MRSGFEGQNGTGDVKSLIKPEPELESPVFKVSKNGTVPYYTITKPERTTTD
jgi:hypothetical protein